MSGLAAILNDRGYSVSGSDKTRNQSTIKLEKLGVLIFNNQNASNLIKICKVKKDIIIVVSSAIPETNKELQAAYKANLKIVHRSDVLAYLIENQEQSTKTK